MRFCPICATSLDDYAVACTRCGSQLPPATVPLPGAPAYGQPTSSSGSSIVLWIVLGVAGLALVLMLACGGVILALGMRLSATSPVATRQSSMPTPAPPPARQAPVLPDLPDAPPGLGDATEASRDAAFDHLDRDRDGKLIQEDFAASPEQFTLLASVLDTNKDGTISREEFQSLYGGGGLPGGPPLGGPTRGGTPGGGGLGGDIRTRGQDLQFRHYDKNGDGQLDDADFPATQRLLFDHLKRRHDKNDDGVIARDEFQR